MYKEGREIRPRCLITGKCIVTESHSTGNRFVVVYWFDSCGQEPVPINLSPVLWHACVFISEVCVCMWVWPWRDRSFYPRCTRVSRTLHTTQPVTRKRSASAICEWEMNFVLVWKSDSSESHVLAFIVHMPKKLSVGFLGATLWRIIHILGLTSADCAGKQLHLWDPSAKVQISRCVVFTFE